jgi:hypothetical protein
MHDEQDSTTIITSNITSVIESSTGDSLGQAREIWTVQIAVNSGSASERRNQSIK